MNIIKEQKFAQRIILEKILDMEQHEHSTTQLKTADEKEFHGNSLCENMVLNGKAYLIENHIFKCVMNDFHSKKIIELIILEEDLVLNKIEYPLEYVAEQAKVDKKFSLRDVQNWKTLECLFVVNNIKKLKLEIKRLNLMGISIKNINKIHEENSTQKITKLTLIRFKKDEYGLTFNDDYKNYITLSKLKRCWDILFRIAEGEIFKLEDIKNQFDYITSNKSNALFKHSQLKKINDFKILRIKNKEIIPNIDMQIITEKSFKIKLKKILN